MSRNHPQPNNNKFYLTIIESERPARYGTILEMKVLYTDRNGIEASISDEYHLSDAERLHTIEYYPERKKRVLLERCFDYILDDLYPITPSDNG